jgi:protein TonB
MTKHFLFYIFILFSNSIFAQEHTIRKFYKFNTEVKDSSKADYYYDFFISDTLTGKGRFVEYTIKGAKQKECECSNTFKFEKEGICTLFNKDGSIKALEPFKNNQWEGILKSYYDNGQLRREDLYKDGEFVSGKCYTSSGADTTHFIYFKKADLDGGQAAIQRHVVTNFRYPEKARRKRIQGRVKVNFIVDENGNISYVKVEEGVHKLLDEAAIKAVKTLPKFNPAISEGQFVKMQFTIPINARLQ